MLELPEVQTVVTQLGHKLVGENLIGFWGDYRLPNGGAVTNGEAGSAPKNDS